MAGAVRGAIAAGRPVYIELMTHGGGSSACKKLGLDFTACGEARVREFRDAAARLGVTGVFVNEFDRDPTTGSPRSLTKSDVTSRLRYWIYRASKQLALRGTAGDVDPSPKYSTTTVPRTHPEHRAVFDALGEAGVADKKAYLVYEFGHYDESVAGCPISGTSPVEYGPCPSGQPTTLEDITAACDEKRDALDAYAVYEPAAGRYAIGAKSVPELISGASNDCNEYAVTFP
jgi:LmbE family N-acetylglucosaminyl deacetylase